MATCWLSMIKLPNGAAKRSPSAPTAPPFSNSTTSSPSASPSVPAAAAWGDSLACGPVCGRRVWRSGNAARRGRGCCRLRESRRGGGVTVGRPCPSWGAVAVEFGFVEQVGTGAVEVAERVQSTRSGRLTRPVLDLQTIDLLEVAHISSRRNTADFQYNRGNAQIVLS